MPMSSLWHPAIFNIVNALLQVFAIKEDSAKAPASLLLSSLVQMTLHVHADLIGYCQGAMKIFWQPIPPTGTAQQKVCRLQPASLPDALCLRFIH